MSRPINIHSSYIIWYFHIKCLHVSTFFLMLLGQYQDNLQHLIQVVNHYFCIFMCVIYLNDKIPGINLLQQIIY